MGNGPESGGQSPESSTKIEFQGFEFDLYDGGAVDRWYLAQAMQTGLVLDNYRDLSWVMVGPHEIGAQVIFPPKVTTINPDYTRDHEGWRLGVYEKYPDFTDHETGEKHEGLVWIRNFEKAPLELKKLSLEALAAHINLVNDPALSNFLKAKIIDRSTRLHSFTIPDSRGRKLPSAEECAAELRGIIADCKIIFGEDWVKENLGFPGLDEN